MVREVNENIKSNTIIPVIVPNFSVQLASAIHRFRFIVTL